MKKIYVLDTSACLTDYNVVYSYDKNDIIIPFKVLEEVDVHKKRQDSVGTNARAFIRFMDNLRKKGSLQTGVRISKGMGVLHVKGYKKPFVPLLDVLPFELDTEIPDNEIIAVAIEAAAPKCEVILVSRDINMRVKADAVGIKTEDYHANKVVEKKEHLYTGHKIHLVSDEVIDDFYAGEQICLMEEEIKAYPNQFIMLQSQTIENHTALTRFADYGAPLKSVYKGNIPIWGISPKNREQVYALDLLMNPDIPIVTLIGKSGSGKTLYALAAGLHQTLEPGRGTNELRYRKVIVSRPIQPLGKDIGYLPGTLEEKMAPWLAPIQDNLQFLLGDDAVMLDEYRLKHKIEIEALTYIRGRSIANAFIIIDEAQNLTLHEIKTIATRVGEGTKIVFTGDIEQIDNVFINEITNGLTNAVEKYKPHSLAGHVTLLKGERSAVATLSSEIL